MAGMVNISQNFNKAHIYEADHWLGFQEQLVSCFHMCYIGVIIYP